MEHFQSTDALEAELAKRVKEAGPGDGIAGRLAWFRGRAVVGDEDLWPYVARRYGLEIVGYGEPSPGVPPTTKHLGELIGRMKAAKVPVILTAPYCERLRRPEPGRFRPGTPGSKSSTCLPHPLAARQLLDAVDGPAPALPHCARTGAGPAAADRG